MRSSSNTAVPAATQRQPAAAATRSPRSELHTKLVWLTVFRTVATSLCLAAVAVHGFSKPLWEISLADSYSFALIAFVYLATLGYSLLLRQGRHGRVGAVLQVAGDIVIATALVFVTGGGQSPFTFAFSLSVIAAAILFGRRGALCAAGAAALAYGALIVALQYGVLAPPGGDPVLSDRELGFVLASNVLALFLVAALVGFLSRELSITGGKLSASKADLESLNKLQSQIFDCLPSGLITGTRDGQVTFVNPSAAAILELGAKPVGGWQLETLLPGALRVAPGHNRDELAVRVGHRTKILGLTVTRLGESSLLIVFQDLTELRRAEEDLRRADRLAGVGTIAAQLAHEIRNPLAAMRGSAQLLAQQQDASATSQQLTKILLRESDRLSRLVDDFLRFARPQSPVKTTLPLDVFLKELADLMRADPMSRGVSLSVSAGAICAEADADQLRQVMLNLIRNALQAAAGRGDVRISADQQGGYARLLVWDSAGSLSADAQRRVFEPFFTTREGGTGLGLSTAQSIIRAHGGSISVRSSPEEGTEFAVRLPLISTEGALNRADTDRR